VADEARAHGTVACSTVTPVRPRRRHDGVVAQRSTSTWERGIDLVAPRPRPLPRYRWPHEGPTQPSRTSSLRPRWLPPLGVASGKPQSLGASCVPAIHLRAEAPDPEDAPPPPPPGEGHRDSSRGAERPRGISPRGETAMKSGWAARLRGDRWIVPAMVEHERTVRRAAAGNAWSGPGGGSTPRGSPDRRWPTR
jgi:hypothetical protein